MTQQIETTRTVVRPQVCPFCGSNDVLTRRVVANIYEMHCSQCRVGAVIHSGDQIALPSAAPAGNKP